jgi:octopine/nopaline transport system ATP-binding protein
MNLLEVPEHGQIWSAARKCGWLRAAASAGRSKATGRQDPSATQHGLSKLQPVVASPRCCKNVMTPVRMQKRPKAEAVAEATLLAKGRHFDKAHPIRPASGRQQQRAAIARALAMRPKVMLFDEPTSALDPELVGEVLRAIRAIADEHRTMLLVTHEMRFAREVASRVLFLHQGQVEEDGPPNEVFDNPRSERCRQFISGRLGG